MWGSLHTSANCFVIVYNKSTIPAWPAWELSTSAQLTELRTPVPNSGVYVDWIMMIIIENEPLNFISLFCDTIGKSHLPVEMVYIRNISLWRLTPYYPFYYRRTLKSNKMYVSLGCCAHVKEHPGDILSQYPIGHILRKY